MAVRVRRTLTIADERDAKGSVVRSLRIRGTFVALIYTVEHRGKARQELEEQADYNGMECERIPSPTTSAYRIWGTDSAHERLATLSCVLLVELIPVVDPRSARPERRTIDKTGQTPT